MSPWAQHEFVTSRCGDAAVGGKGIKEAAGGPAPEARTAKEAAAKVEDDVEVSTFLLICHVCYGASSSAHVRHLQTRVMGDFMPCCCICNRCALWHMVGESARIVARRLVGHRPWGLCMPTAKPHQCWASDLMDVSTLQICSAAKF